MPDHTSSRKGYTAQKLRILDLTDGVFALMNDASYQEIADILQVPFGTVRSRISRGIAQLKQFILAGTCRPTAEDA
jgi:hypothetical protein